MYAMIQEAAAGPLETGLKSKTKYVELMFKETFMRNDVLIFFEREPIFKDLKGIRTSYLSKKFL